MASKAVSLTVHRNTKRQRRAKRLRVELKAAAREIGQLRDIDGYAVVTWSGDRVLTSWEVTKEHELHNLPEKVRMALAGDIHRKDYEE